MGSTYKDNTPIERRKQMAARVKERYPDRLPIICEPIRNETKMRMDKRKFLCPSTLRMSHFIVVIKSRIKDLKPTEAIYIYVNNSIIPPNTMTVSEAYEKYADEDGLLYIQFAKENTFG